MTTTATLDMATALLDGALLNGGATIPAPDSGYMVGGVNTLALDVATAEVDAIAAWIAETTHQDVTHVGSWLDGSTLYLDGCENIESRSQAVALAGARGELAIWDVSRGAEITTTVRSETANA